MRRGTHQVRPDMFLIAVCAVWYSPRRLGVLKRRFEVRGVVAVGRECRWGSYLPLLAQLTFGDAPFVRACRLGCGDEARMCELQR
jgi:hypothetical protein